MPPAPFEAPRTSINGAISSHRRVAFADLPLADIRRVAGCWAGRPTTSCWRPRRGPSGRSSPAGTRSRTASLVAWCRCRSAPRPKQGALGNRVSAMLVSLATGVEDPAARLGRIRDGVRSAKEQSRSVGPEVFSAWAEAVLPAVATRLSRLVTNLRVFDHLAPMFNLIVSNVPGPGRAALPGRGPDGGHLPDGPDHRGRRGQRHRLLLSGHAVTSGCRRAGTWCRTSEVLARAMEESLAELVQRPTGGTARSRGGTPNYLPSGVRRQPGSAVGEAAVRAGSAPSRSPGRPNC